MSILSDWKIEGGSLVRVQRQASRDLILGRNAELRKNPDAISDLTFAGLELQIPLLDLAILRKKYPDLNSPDGKTRTDAWRRFFGSSESDPYRVRDRRRARGKATTFTSHRPTTANRCIGG